MKALNIALLGFITLTMCGCSSTLMKRADIQIMTPPGTQTSRVIFLRESAFGGAIQASIFDASSEDLKFVGVSSTGTKVAYDTIPGIHRFMVVSEAADFMEATLDGGKTYYAMVTPRMGMWKARFSLWPIKSDANARHSLQSKAFVGWLELGKFVINTPEGDQWFRANASGIKQKYNAYLPDWKRKTPQALAERTLDAKDGVVGR